MFLRLFRSPLFSLLLASTTISISWAFANAPHRPLDRFVMQTAIAWLIAFVICMLLARLIAWCTQKVSSTFIAHCILIASLTAIILVVRDQLAQLFLIALLIPALYLYIRKTISALPDNEALVKTTDAHFLFFYTILAITGAFQYLNFLYALIDAKREKIYTIVVFRTFAITFLWMAGASFAGLWYRYIPGFLRALGPVVWMIAWLFASLVLIVNVSVLYYSGLPIGPAALEHLAGSDEVIQSSSVLPSIVIFIVMSIIVGLALRQLMQSLRATRGWIAIDAVIIALAMSLTFSASLLRDTPEGVMTRSFTDYYLGTSYVKTLNPILQEKLKKFGLTYTTDAFLVSTHNRIYDPTIPAPKLAQRFTATPPNILIIFLESFSTRLTSVYNNRFPGLTPGLEKMAQNKNTTVFKNFYNASTPTETGMLADLCSFLPPTGHGEIIKNGALTRHQLSCLPEILKKNGYGSAFYTTAVESTYASKDKLFGKAGIDTIYGREKLKTMISEEPLSWGYSDHQLFPQLLPIMERHANRPFFGMMTTIDSHPPFTLSKDRARYADNRNLVLNAFYSTDHAFAQFWDDFQKSPLAQNTIVITVADHAVFPTVSVKELFSDEAKTLGFYDEIAFMMYVPDSPLPKQVTTYASSLDLTPTLLHLLRVNVPNAFEGHSIFDVRAKFPNLVGIHELGLYINQEGEKGKRKIEAGFLQSLRCPREYVPDATAPLTMCDLNELYQWKRTMLEAGRLWKPKVE